MNDTLLFNELANSKATIFVYEPKETLTTWGIFLSSIILSSTAFITGIMAQIQKSKCSKIDCLGCKCIRDLP